MVCKFEFSHVFLKYYLKWENSASPEITSVKNMILFHQYFCFPLQGLQPWYLMIYQPWYLIICDFFCGEKYKPPLLQCHYKWLRLQKDTASDQLVKDSVCNLQFHEVAWKPTQSSSATHSLETLWSKFNQFSLWLCPIS